MFNPVATNNSIEHPKETSKSDAPKGSLLSAFYNDVYRQRRIYMKGLEGTLRVISRPYTECGKRAYDVSLNWDRDPLLQVHCAAKDFRPALSPCQLISKLPKGCKGTRTLYKKPDIQKIHHDVLNEILDRAFSLYIGVIECLYINMNFTPRHSNEETLDFYLTLVLQGRMEEFFKYFTLKVFSVHRTQKELPPRSALLSDLPENVYVCLGATGRFIRKVMSGFRTHNSLSTLLSLTTVKNCGLPLSHEKQSVFFNKHVLNMLGEGYEPPLWENFPNYERDENCMVVDMPEEKLRRRFNDIDDLIFSQMNEIAFDIFGERKKQKSFQTKWKAPSQGSTVEYKRSQCGGMGFIYNEFECSRNSELVGFANLGPTVPIIKVTRDGHPDDYKAELYDILRKTYPPESWTLGRPANFCSYLSATVHGVLEPFKVRPITAGEAAPYQFARMLQTPIWGRLKCHPVFVLTGKRATDEAFVNILDTWCPFSDIWVAGDYEAASDGINPIFSQYMQERIAEQLGLTVEETYWYLLSMLGHELNYDQVLEDGPVIRQEWGQLMGSPSSFPILCLINAAAFSAAVHDFERRSPDEACCRRESVCNKLDIENIRQIDRLLYLHLAYGLLINGDDILFHGPCLLVDLWEQYERYVGLKPSVGKNFKCASSEGIVWSMINNTIFTFDITSDCSISGVHLLPFVKMGLAEGKSKVQGDSRDDRMEVDDDLMAVLDKLEECHYGFKEMEEKKLKVREVFLHHNIVKMQRSKRSWSLPRALGGLGMSFLDTVPNSTQLRVAQYLWSHPNETAPCTKVAPVFDNKVVLPRVNFTLTREEKQDTWSNFGAGYWLAEEVETVNEGFTRLMNLVSPKHGKYPPEIISEAIFDYRKKRSLPMNL